MIKERDKTMLSKNNYSSISNETPKLKMYFWITYILFVTFSIILIPLSSFPIFPSLFVVISAIIILILRNFLKVQKLFFRIILWSLIFIASGILLVTSQPKLIKRTPVNTTHLVYTKAVQTQYGCLSGVYNNNGTIAVYAGIPYAKPPIGDLRWKAPQEPDKWQGIRKADKFSDAAMQSYLPSIFTNLAALQEGTQSLTPIVSNNEPSSEDCLYLNIWTKKNSSAISKRPVIVYIHGGSFLNGSGSLDEYNGESMAQKGAVFVTINYRLGVFGFLSNTELSNENSSHTSGNYGILDQIAALKWIKNNISAFGGDPYNITIAGESAGSMSVNMLQASSLTKGLFQRVIGESGSNFGSRGTKGNDMDNLEKAEKVGDSFEKTLKKTSLAELRGMPASKLLKAAGNFSFRPIVDGYVLSDSVYNIYAKGKENAVPTLIGYNENESSVFIHLPFPFTLSSKASLLSAKDFEDTIKKTYGNYSHEFLSIFPSSDNSQSQKSQLASGTVQWFGWHMHTWAELQSQTGSAPVYLYYFNQLQPGNDNFHKLGVYHSSEIGYAYGNLNKTGIAYQKQDQQLSKIMSSYWYNFASTGNPNGDGLPKWDAFNSQKNQVMELGKEVKMITSPNQEYMNFFDRYESYLREKSKK